MRPLSIPVPGGPSSCLDDSSAAGEDGQTMLFMAIVMSALLLTLGLAVQGGQAYAKYRQLQSAADISALVGAQKLPCSLTDTACTAAAQQAACDTASNNGFSTCTAYVPPQACSPYNGYGYGNTSNASCGSRPNPQYYDYIEAQLSYSMGTVPIFNIPVTIGAHAVAKNGVLLPSDFAFIQLDPDGCINMSGTVNVNIGGSAYANGCVNAGSQGRYVCQGGWLSNGSQGKAANLITDNSGTIIYAPDRTKNPQDCTGGNDTTYNNISGLPQFGDPYCPTPSICSLAPPGTSYAGCPQCTKNGAWRTFNTTSQTWNNDWHFDGSSPSGGSGVYELFPGIYTGEFYLSNGAVAYLNPGVYTFQGGYSTNHGKYCVWGAPTCDDGNTALSSVGNCSQDAFGQAGANADIWYYNCSPYGYWDQTGANAAAAAGGSSFDATQPVFMNAAGSRSSTPLNGVTMNVGDAGLIAHGNGGKDCCEYLAAPNPCPGTGTYTSTSVTWQDSPADGHSGATGATFAYDSTHVARFGMASSPSTANVYPSVDFSLLGECTVSKSLYVWPGEMVTPQHLHFVIWDSGGGTLNGASGQNLTGIVYNRYSASCAPDCTISVNGAGKGNGGPPWITGQLVSWNTDLGGTASIDIVYRPCSQPSSACGSGHGTQLVQ